MTIDDLDRLGYALTVYGECATSALACDDIASWEIYMGCMWWMRGYVQELARG